MSGEEIEVPRGVREFMPEWVQETVLGEPHGARRQYRYGNLHIREYDDVFRVHADAADPRRDPLGHLIHDAPEVLVGLGCALAGGGFEIARRLAGGGRGRGPRAIAGLLALAAASGYLGYAAAKEIKKTYGRQR